MTAEDVLAELRRHANPKNVEGMARFGISSDGTLGISLPTLRAIAKRCARDHALALALWDSGIHEAKHVAVMVEDPKTVTKKQLESWVRDLDSWDVCDGFSWGFVDRTPHGYDLAMKWSRSKREFVKRAAFATMAGLAVHDKKAPDEQLLQFLPVIRCEAGDDRNFVRKAANWALRQIGKRNLACNKAAIATAEQIRADGTKSGRWIAADALRELRSEAVQARLEAAASASAGGKARSRHSAK
ncbi:MAG: DNA alkylation repair protein [Chloroflexi bacterium]|nr:DNA alkylation repair protein [Chloroflexota bacterium]